MLYLLRHLRKLSCKKNPVNHCQPFLPLYYYSCYYLFFIIIVFSYFNQNFSCKYFEFYFFYFYLVPGVFRMSWNLVIVFVSQSICMLCKSFIKKGNAIYVIDICKLVKKTDYDAKIKK